MMTPMPLVWLDLETTGLNPDACSIIAIGVRHTTPALETVSEFETIVRPWFNCQWDLFAKEMHEKSGLKARCEDPFAPSLTEAIREVSRFLANVQASTGSDQLLMAGNSIHFDRSFLDTQSRSLLKPFSHRHLDVSFFKAMYMSQGWELPKKDVAHTPLADIDASIRELRYFGGSLDFNLKGWNS